MEPCEEFSQKSLSVSPTVSPQPSRKGATKLAPPAELPPVFQLPAAASTRGLEESSPCVHTPRQTEALLLEVDAALTEIGPILTKVLREHYAVFAGCSNGEWNRQVSGRDDERERPAPPMPVQRLLPPRVDEDDACEGDVPAEVPPKPARGLHDASVQALEEYVSDMFLASSLCPGGSATQLRGPPPERRRRRHTHGAVVPDDAVTNQPSMFTYAAQVAGLVSRDTESHFSRQLSRQFSRQCSSFKDGYRSQSQSAPDPHALGSGPVSFGRSQRGDASTGSLPPPTILEVLEVVETSNGDRTDQPPATSVSEASWEPILSLDSRLLIMQDENNGGHMTPLWGIGPSQSAEPDSTCGEASDRHCTLPISLARTAKSGATQRGLTVGQVMHECVDDIALQVSESDKKLRTRRSANSAVPRLLPLLGILPWDEGRPCTSGVYLFATRVAIFGASGLFLYNLAVNRWTQGKMTDHLCHLTLPIGAVAGWASLWTSGRLRLKSIFGLLNVVAEERGFRTWHSRHMRAPAALYLLLWLCCVGALAWDCEDDLVHNGLLVFFSGLLLCLSFLMACICRILSKSVDSFCCQAVSQLHVTEISTVWNLTQAVVRKASGSIEYCMIASGFVVAAVLPLVLSGKTRVIMSGEAAPDTFRISMAPALVSCGVAYVVVTAAAVSEKCARVPALINAVSFGPCTDFARQRVVDYIVGSAAGFYLFGIRVTMSMVFKFVYGWTMVGVALGSRGIVSSQ